MTGRMTRQIGSSRRNRRHVRGKVLAQTIVSRDEILGFIAGLELDTLRPRTRGDCSCSSRPCPWICCRHHLYLDVNPVTGSIKLNFPHLDVGELHETCALDVADRGGITLDEVGEIINLSGERVRQIEASALASLREQLGVSGEDLGTKAEPRSAESQSAETDQDRRARVADAVLTTRSTWGSRSRRQRYTFEFAAGDEP